MNSEIQEYLEPTIQFNKRRYIKSWDADEMTFLIFDGNTDILIKFVEGQTGIYFECYINDKCGFYAIDCNDMESCSHAHHLCDEANPYTIVVFENLIALIDECGVYMKIPPDISLTQT